MKVWVKKGEIFCLSDKCTDDCPNFETCIEVSGLQEYAIRTAVGVLARESELGDR